MHLLNCLIMTSIGFSLSIVEVQADYVINQLYNLRYNTIYNDSVVADYLQHCAECVYRFYVNDSQVEPVTKSGNDVGTVKVNGLTAGTLYALSGVTVEGNATSSPVTVDFVSRPNLPELVCIPGSDQVQLAFFRPQGEVAVYLLSCYINGSANDVCQETITVDPAALFQLYTFPVPSNSYSSISFVYFSLSHSQDSEQNGQVVCSNKESAPGIPRNFRTLGPVGPLTVVLAWDAPVQPNGRIRNYYILYEAQSPATDRGFSNYTLDSLEFTSQSSISLLPGYVYNISIQAVTVEPGPATWIIVTAEEDSASDAGISVGALVGAIVGGVVGLLLLLVLVIIIAVRFQRTKKAKETLAMENAITIQSKSIPCSEFEKHYRIMSADSNVKFRQEYEKLQNVGANLPRTSAELPANKPKNLLPDGVLPYDSTRVLLRMSAQSQNKSSDYINANWIAGVNSARKYIAAQGPLLNTREDFWRMIWDSDCSAVVTLKNFHQTRCVQYLPAHENEPLIFGDIIVRAVSKKHLHETDITELIVEKNSQTRQLAHFHFLAWTSADLPTSSSCLLQFIRLVRGKIDHENGKPILVHCDTGVGATAVFIALDRLLQHLRTNSDLDIFGVVHDLRLRRPKMVSTTDQYIFLHRAVLDVLRPSPGGVTNVAYTSNENIYLPMTF